MYKVCVSIQDPILFDNDKMVGDSNTDGPENIFFWTKEITNKL